MAPDWAVQGGEEGVEEMLRGRKGMSISDVDAFVLVVRRLTRSERASRVVTSFIHQGKPFLSARNRSAR